VVLKDTVEDRWPCNRRENLSRFLRPGTRVSEHEKENRGMPLLLYGVGGAERAFREG